MRLGKQRKKGRRIKRIRHRREIEMNGKKWRREEGKWDGEGDGRLSGDASEFKLGAVKGEPEVTHVSAGQP